MFQQQPLQYVVMVRDILRKERALLSKVKPVFVCLFGFCFKKNWENTAFQHCILFVLIYKKSVGKYNNFDIYLPKALMLHYITIMKTVSCLQPAQMPMPNQPQYPQSSFPMQDVDHLVLKVLEVQDIRQKIHQQQEELNWERQNYESLQG